MYVLLKVHCTQNRGCIGTNILSSGRSRNLPELKKYQAKAGTDLIYIKITAHAHVYAKNTYVMTT